MAGKINSRDATGRTVNLTGVRLSFTDSLHTAKVPKKSPPGTKAQHSVNIILERNHKDFDSNRAAVISALKATCRKFKKPETWWKDLFDDDPKQIAFRKGERFKDGNGQIYKGYEGNLVIVAKGPGGGLKRPVLKDRHKRDVDEKDILDVFYGGTYADAIVSFYATDNGGTQRITCSVEGMRSHQQGERMGGGGVGVSDDDFENLEDDDDGIDAPAGDDEEI